MQSVLRALRRGAPGSGAVGSQLTFRFDGRSYGDEETGSEWSLSGQAVSGPLKGEKLEPLPSRYTFWFAYVAAFPDTELFAPQSPMRVRVTPAAPP